jgi:hypothetical protein
VVLDILKFCCSQCVPNKFPTPSSSSPKFIMCQLYHLRMIQCEWVNIEIYIIFYVWNKYFYIGKSLKFQVVFFCEMSQSKKPITKKEKKEGELWAPLQLIYTNHTILYSKVLQI